jgi:hypothetical protein
MSNNKECEELRTLILTKTNQIPPHIRNSCSYQEAIKFKEDALKAVKIANSRQNNIGKLREAWGSISGYYA